MATANPPTDYFHINNDDQQLKISCLIWLDANDNLGAIRETEQKLRSIVNRFKKFQDIKECQKYIEEQSQQDRLVMIVSGRLGREIVPSIHKLPQVLSIYVYCMDKRSNEKWAAEYSSKVKAVFVELDELIFRIKADHRRQRMVREPLSINLFTPSAGAGKSTTDANFKFLFYQVLIDCLLRLKSTHKDIKEFLEFCKQKFEGNDEELRNIREFEKHYSPDKALWWYSRESFFYKTLNAALRTQDIHLIFLFRAFIFDICHQLESYQTQKLIRTYRGQMLSSDELKTLRECCDHFISVNSFFSTTFDCQRALSLTNAYSVKAGLERVIFQIDADPKMVTTKPFADLSSHSKFKDEAEVLFVLGSIFRLNSVNRSSNGQLWIIQMTLWNDDDNDLKQILVDMKQQLPNGETNLQTLGKVLWEMGKPDLAEKYFIRFSKQLQPDDPLLMDLYIDLGKLASQNGDYEKSIKWHKNVIALKKQKQSTVSSNTNKTNSSMMIPNIPTNARWAQNGSTVAGGHEVGSATHQLFGPCGIFFDNDQTILIADGCNNRIIQWKLGYTKGQVVAGGHGPGNRSDQLSFPTDVLIDKATDSLIICDRGNRRVLQWSRHRNTIHGEILLNDINCYGLAMDDQRCLYVSDTDRHQVRRYQIGDINGTVVAGGFGLGTYLNLLNEPTFLFVDQQQAVYVSEYYNHRVTKWKKGAKEGILVAGGLGNGNTLAHLSYPRGLSVDTLGAIYVADTGNNRVMLWPKRATQGIVIVGDNGPGKETTQLSGPEGLSFDQYGNLYIVDGRNDRVQRFSIEKTS